MKTTKTYIKRIAKMVPAIGAAALMLVSTNSCERRDLYVYQDYFKQLKLLIDWRHYDRDKFLYPHTPDPTGMTVYLYPTDGRKADHYTTANVTVFESYLSKGNYEALVIDYSPSEYGKQEFLGMDYANTAKVQSTPQAYQPKEDSELYGAPAYAKDLMTKQPTGFWTIANQPEVMGSDTTMMDIRTGKYDHYIPYEERDSYQSTLVQQVYQMYPLIVPWQMRVRIPIKGIYYLYKTQGTLAGMADGVYLAENHTSNDPCILQIDDWEVFVTGDNVGYIAKTFYTWGMRDALWKDYDGIRQRKSWVVGQQTPEPFFVSSAAKDELRLNLAITLRDRKTVCHFHIDCGNQVEVYGDTEHLIVGNANALSLDLREVLTGDDIPELPYVEGVNGLDFGGVVIPWKDGENVHVSF
jgi:hypothetical protein